jgi:hypothetical protein
LCQEPTLPPVLRHRFGKHQPGDDRCLISTKGLQDTRSAKLKRSLSDDVCSREQTCPRAATREDSGHEARVPDDRGMILQDSGAERECQSMTLGETDLCGINSHKFQNAGPWNLLLGTQMPQSFQLPWREEDGTSRVSIWPA